MSLGTGIKVVASRVLCLSICAVLKIGPFSLTHGYARTGSLNETQSFTLWSHKNGPLWSFTLCQLQLSQVMPQDDWGGRALQKLFPAGSWSWGQGHPQGHFLYWYRHSFSRFPNGVETSCWGLQDPGTVKWYIFCRMTSTHSPGSSDCTRNVAGCPDRT